MRWTPTHRIIATARREGPETFEVMAFDLGCDHPGPGRYALFTREEWEAGTPADWTMDVEGQVWFQGGSVPPGGSATAQGIWDD
ncbi:MAG TPA: hypothetical protein VLT62_05355 [Candidatus Methylomirabilis sp.]|nr:hypothetical protein [Candidatus Methylomirabilis sp.]